MSLIANSKRTFFPFVIALPFLLRIWLVWQDFELLVKRSPLLEDDYFYYLNIARNMLAGKGITADGQTQTTGIQWLHQGLCVLVSVLFSTDSLLPFRIILTLQVLISAGSAVMLYAIVKKISSVEKAKVAIFLFSWWLPIMRYGNNGMETVLQIFTILSVLYCLVQFFFRPSIRQGMFIAILCGVSVFVRIDMVALSIGVTIALFIFAKHNTEVKQVFLRTVFYICGSAVTGLLLLFAMNIAINGNWLPDSGVAVRDLAKIYSATQPGGDSFFSNLGHAFSTIIGDQPFSQFFQAAGLGMKITMWETLGCWLLGVLFFIKRKVSFSSVYKNIHYAILLYSVMLFSFYVVWTPAYWFFGRYLFPVSLLSLMLASEIIIAMRDAVNVRFSNLSRSFFLLAAGLFFAIGFGQRWFHFMYDEVKTIPLEQLKGKTISETQVEHNYDIAKWISANIPSDERIAMWQGGLVSYAAKRDIIHLDGVVNREALTARNENNLGEYLKKKQIDYFIDFTIVAPIVLAHSTDAEHTFKYLGTSNVDSTGNPVVVYRIVR